MLPSGPDELPPGEDVVALGADLAPGTVLAAYRSGLFPMPIRDGRRELLAWWSPEPRGIVPLDGLRVSRSLRRSCARFDVRVDTACAAVIDACADPGRDGRWITPAIRDAYLVLHELGWVHSVEAWDAGGTLAGGLYGVAVGGLFAGESMFHRATDASKVALVGLVDLLRSGGADLLDVQWVTPHLASLGAVEVPRARYLSLVAEAVARPALPVWPTSRHRLATGAAAPTSPSLPPWPLSRTGPRGAPPRPPRTTSHDKGADRRPM